MLIWDILLSGTHNSGAYFTNEEGIKSAWILCQSLSIYEQLHLGIKYLDLRVRVCPDTGILYIAHNSYLTVTLETVLADISKYFEEDNARQKKTKKKINPIANSLTTIKDSTSHFPLILSIKIDHGADVDLLYLDYIILKHLKNILGGPLKATTTTEDLFFSGQRILLFLQHQERYNYCSNDETESNNKDDYSWLDGADQKRNNNLKREKSLSAIQLRTSRYRTRRFSTMYKVHNHLEADYQKVKTKSQG